MKKNIIIIGVSNDYSKYFFKLSPDNDFSFTPWSFELADKDNGCIHDKCLEYISNDIFYGGYQAQIEDLDYICTKNTPDSKTDIFIYQSDEFMNRINCDYLIFDEKTLDYSFNLFNSWILAHIYNKYNRNSSERYYF